SRLARSLCFVPSFVDSMPWQRITPAATAAAPSPAAPCRTPTRRLPRRLGKATRSSASIAATQGHSYHRLAPAATPARARVMLEEIELYLHHLRAERHASPHTLRSYRSDLEELGAFLAEGGPRARDVAVGRISIGNLRAFAATKLRVARR